MSIFLDIVKQYAATDQVFAEIIQSALVASDAIALNAAVEQRSHNDQAYLLYMFTRLEAVINECFEDLVSARSIGNWHDTRPWLYFGEHKSYESLSLLAKTAMLTGKGGQDWKQIQRYYAERNSIAHGASWAQAFAIPSTGNDMQEIVNRFSIN